jgi:hypothetical protein
MGQQPCVRDLIEARLQVGIQDKFRFEPNTIEDGSDGIMT